MNDTNTGPLKNPWTWVAIFMLIAIVALVLIGLVPWDWVQHKDAASWVQAVGSLLGIAIAIGVPAWQHAASERRARKDRVEEFGRVLSIALGHACSALWRLEKLARLEEENDAMNQSSGLHVESFRRVLSAMREIPSLQLPNSYSAQVFLDLQHKLEATIAATDFFGSAIATGLKKPESGKQYWRAQWANFNDDVARLQWSHDVLFNPKLLAPDD